MVRLRAIAGAGLLASTLLAGGVNVAASEVAPTAYPGANGRLAFEWWTDTADGGSTIESYAINPDGTDLVALGVGGSLAFSPDGRRIAFVGGDGIYVADADGSNPARVTADSGDDVPSWSPDGTRIVFAGTRPEDQWGYHVYMVNVDGTGLRRLTAPDPEAFAYYPVFSPDGTRIAFSRDSETIHVLDLATGTELQVTPQGTLADYPEWSPDGSQIAFIAYTDDDWIGVDELYVINADGTSPRRVLANSGSDIFDRPAWSPDGTKLAFATLHKAPAQSYGLYVIGIDGTGLTRLTDSANIQANVAWQPLPSP